jgi:hypothetical protein
VYPTQTNLNKFYNSLKTSKEKRKMKQTDKEKREKILWKQRRGVLLLFESKHLLYLYITMIFILL